MQYALMFHCSGNIALQRFGVCLFLLLFKKKKNLYIYFSLLKFSDTFTHWHIIFKSKSLTLEDRIIESICHQTDFFFSFRWITSLLLKGECCFTATVFPLPLPQHAVASEYSVQNSHFDISWKIFSIYRKTQKLFHHILLKKIPS